MERVTLHPGHALILTVRLPKGIRTSLERRIERPVPFLMLAGLSRRPGVGDLMRLRLHRIGFAFSLPRPGVARDPPSAACCGPPRPDTAPRARIFPLSRSSGPVRLKTLVSIASVYGFKGQGGEAGPGPKDGSAESLGHRRPTDRTAPRCTRLVFLCALICHETGLHARS